jgi:hypothetical protein
MVPIDEVDVVLRLHQVPRLAGSRVLPNRDDRPSPFSSRLKETEAVLTTRAIEIQELVPHRLRCEPDLVLRRILTLVKRTLSNVLGMVENGDDIPMLDLQRIDSLPRLGENRILFNRVPVPIPAQLLLADPRRSLQLIPPSILDVPQTTDLLTERTTRLREHGSPLHRIHHVLVHLDRTEDLREPHIAVRSIEILNSVNRKQEIEREQRIRLSQRDQPRVHHPIPLRLLRGRIEHLPIVRREHRDEHVVAHHRTCLEWQRTVQQGGSPTLVVLVIDLVLVRMWHVEFGHYFPPLTCAAIFDSSIPVEPMLYLLAIIIFA